jgi:hypothetical protein
MFATAEKMHESMMLPETAKPKFMVPRNLSIPKFIEVKLTMPVCA